MPPNSSELEAPNLHAMLEEVAVKPRAVILVLLTVVTLLEDQM